MTSTLCGNAMGVSAVVGIHLYKLQIETGTILTPAFCAILMAPDFIVCRRPSGDRVPSAKVTTELPFFRASTTALKASSWLRLSMRLIPMCPAICMAQPMMGIARISCFDMYLKARGTVPDRVKMSR